ncbi:MAG: hypothetical protein JWO76_3355 [Nocardioides sp.]|nr:hypothetical protein [Nocardioides sp.]
MNASHTPIEAQARHEIADRVQRASEPHLPTVPYRHRFALRLRRVADRIDN